MGLAEQQLGALIQSRIVLAFGKDRLELGEQRMRRVHLEDPLGLGHRLAHLLEHALHARGHVVLVANQTRGG